MAGKHLGLVDRAAQPAELVDEAVPEGVGTGPHPAAGDGFDGLHGELAALGDAFDEVGIEQVGFRLDVRVLFVGERSVDRPRVGVLDVGTRWRSCGEVTGTEPVLWGPSMIGFGRHRYTTADGKEHETFVIGLSPRREALTLYGLTLYGSNMDLLDRLGPHSTGKSCLYAKRLDALDRSVLADLIERSWRTNHDPGDRPVRSG